MNETTNQRKSIGRGVFAAIVAGFVIVVVLVGWMLSRGSNRTEQVVTTPSSTVVVTGPASVTEFENYLRDHPAEEAMAKDHAFTSDGMRLLAAAMESLSQRDGLQGAEVSRQLARLRQEADNIQANEDDTSHAASIRAAFISAAGLMTTLQQQRYPALAMQADQMRHAAEAIDPDRLTLAQKAEVGVFFSRASELLRTMAQTN